MKKLLTSLMGLGVLWSLVVGNAWGQLPSNDDLTRLFKDTGRPVSYTELAKGNPMDLAVGQNFYFVLIQSANQNQEDCVIVIDKKTGSPKTTWYLGRNGACAATLEGNTLWILSRNKAKFLRCYDLQGVLTKTIAADNIPSGKIYGLALAGEKLYFVVHNDNGDKSAVVEMDRQMQACRTIREISGWLPSLTWHRGKLWGWYSEKPPILKNVFAQLAHWLTRWYSEKTGFITLKNVFDLSLRSFTAWYSDRPERMCNGEWLFSLDPAHAESFRLWRDFSVSFPLIGLDSDERILYGLVRRKNGFQIVPFGVWESPGLLIRAPITRQVTFGERFKEDSGNSFNLTFFLAQPENKPFQKVEQVQWRVCPTKILEDRWGNHWAQIELKEIKDQEVSVSFVNTSWTVQFQEDLSQKFDPKKVPSEILRDYTRETFCFDCSSERVQVLARKLPEASTWRNKIIGVENLMNHNLKCDGPSGPWVKASEILEKGVGRCYGHTVVFCALGRAAGLPIRAIGGIGIGQDQDNEFAPGTDLSCHTWNQVFIPGQGWVDFDAIADYYDLEARYPLQSAGWHRGDLWVTFSGDYDKADNEKVFTERDWFESINISSPDPARKVSVQNSTIIRVKTVDGTPTLFGQ
ncbi:MAG: transglutaminase family protein [Thermoguttaceae bacterium]